MRRALTIGFFLVNAGVVLLFGAIHARFIGHYPFAGTSRFAWMAVFVGALWLWCYAAGLPDVPRTGAGALVSSLVALAAGAGVISVIQLVLGSSLLPRFVVFGAPAALLPIDTALVLGSERLRRAREQSDRVVVVASEQDGALLANDLGGAPERPARIVAVLDPGWLQGDGAEGLAEVAERADATVVVLDRVAQLSEQVVADASRLHQRGVRIRTLSLFYDEWLGKLPVGELERMSLMFDIQELHAHRYANAKRFFDLLFGACALVALVIVTPVVAVLDLIGNRGPLLYRQTRLGKGSVPFTILKFRTMPPDGASTEWTAVDDERLSPVGRWLRRTHLDELPQALNIVRGDLSLVGPRPEQPRYVAELSTKIPFYDVRHLVKPGLTGWAQVKYQYGASVADALEKLQYEFYYLRHQSLGLDARIVARTLRAVLRRHGR